jgi:hypothetical protein
MNPQAPDASNFSRDRSRAAGRKPALQLLPHTGEAERRDRSLQFSWAPQTVVLLFREILAELNVRATGASTPEPACWASGRSKKTNKKSKKKSLDFT